MHSWLEEFAYRATISAWIFVGAVISSVLLALLTICSQAIRAAVSNPVKSLRIE
jgi:putative ABC transport system permease protein